MAYFRRRRLRKRLPNGRAAIDEKALPAYKARDVAAYSRPQRFLAAHQPPHRFEDR